MTDLLIDIEKLYGSRFRNLFDSSTYHSVSFIKRGFAIPRSITKQSILFVGLNPSFPEGAISDSHFYDLNQSGNYSYFKKFEILSTEADVTWSHFDLLGIRETSQSKVLSLLKSELGFEFIWKNLQLSKEILEVSEPLVIIVANTAARTFLGKDIEENGTNEWLGYQFTFDENLGTYRINDKRSKLNGTPVFFTSMLTGQRALDNGSFERLIWHVKKAIGRD